MKANQYIYLICILLLTFWACKSSNQSTIDHSSADTSLDVNIMDEIWVVKKLSIQSKQIPIFEDYQIKFNNNNLALTLDLNHCGYGYTLMKEGKINISDQACTERCCDSEQAIMLSKAMINTFSYHLIEDGLVLQNEDIYILCTKKLATIKQIKWKAFSMSNSDENQFVKFDNELFLTVTDSLLLLSLNANKCRTRIQLNDRDRILNVDNNLACTKMCCDDAQSLDLKAQFMDKMSFKRIEDTLQLNNGKKIINFVAYDQAQNE